MRRNLLTCFVIVLGLACTCLGRTWYVQPDGTGDAPNIQAAVDSAHTGDSIVLSDGVFSGSGNRDVVVEKSLSFTSESGDPADCIIDCQGTSAERHRAFVGDATYLMFEGLTIKNGYHSEAGAMDLATNMDGEITVHRCRFVNNHAGYGGAIRCMLLGYDAYIISECVFERNVAEYYGGGLFLERHLNPDGLCRITDCTFLDNFGYYGAAVAEWLYLPPLTAVSDQDVGTHMNGCTIAANGGVCAFFGTAMAGERIIIANNNIGTPFLNSLPELACSNVYGNAGGDWIGVLEDQYRVRGNIRVCPSFCSLPQGDLRLCDESLCLPGRHPDDYECGLIGSREVGCACGPSETHPTTWGAIKATYR